MIFLPLKKRHLFAIGTLLCLILLCGCAGTVSMVERGSDKASAQMFPINADVADKILVTAMMAEFGNSPISRVEFPNKGYQITTRPFVIEHHTYFAYMIPAKGRSGTGKVVPGYAFEVNHSGSMPTGHSRSSKLLKLIVDEATRMASPLPLVSLGQPEAPPTHEKSKVLEKQETSQPVTEKAWINPDIK